MARHLSLRGKGLGLLAAASLLATAACGSTVQTGGSTRAGGDAAGPGVVGSDGLGGDGLGGAGAGGIDGLGAAGSTGSGSTGSGPGGAGTALGGGTGGSGGSGGTGGSGGGTSGGSSGGGAAPSGTAGAPRTSAAQGPGITAKEIFVGVRETKNLEKARQAFGVGSADSGDYRADVEALIAEVNARGGVAGRKLSPVWHTDDATSAETVDARDQAACETFTVDNKIAATIAGGGLVFSACMKKAGVLWVTGSGLIGPDEKDYRDAPNYVEMGGLTQDRMMADLVRALQRQIYFSGWDEKLGQPATTTAKIGILGWAFAQWVRPQDRVMLPALARIGRPVDPELVIRLSEPKNGNADAGQFAAEVSSAVLRFKGAGVTHVIMLDSGGIITLTFTKNAENQGYFPRLGINTAAGLQYLSSLPGSDTKAYAGAIGLGWKPTLDLPRGQGDRYLTSATTECLKIISKRTGQNFTDTNAASVALSVCDAIFGVAEAFKRAGPVLNVSTGVRGLESLGNSFRAASVPKVFLGPGRHDGLELGFDMAWDTACRCIKFKDNGHRIPAA